MCLHKGFGKSWKSWLAVVAQRPKDSQAEITELSHNSTHLPVKSIPQWKSIRPAPIRCLQALEAKLLHDCCDDHITSTSCKDARVIGHQTDEETSQHVSSISNGPVAEKILHPCAGKCHRICACSKPVPGSCFEIALQILDTVYANC